VEAAAPIDKIAITRRETLVIIGKKLPERPKDA
jgi:hypothetical protein